MSCQKYKITLLLPTEVEGGGVKIWQLKKLHLQLDIFFLKVFIKTCSIKNENKN